MSRSCSAGRREPPDDLTRGLRQARRLWEAFFATCNERDRRSCDGDLQAAEASAVTIRQLDTALEAVEAHIRQLDDRTAA